MSGEGKLDDVFKLVDMFAIFILSDLMLIQHEKDKSDKETGKKYSVLLEAYKQMVEWRAIIVRVIETLKKTKGAILLAAGLYLVESLINAAYTAVMNLIYSLIKDMLKLLSHTIEHWQNMQLERKIGTNPSHSQLAKDDFEHPLHSLAGKLAMTAVFEIGKDVKFMIDNFDKFIPDTTIKAITDKAKSFMLHPNQTAWADTIAKEWIQQNPNRLEQQHEAHYQFLTAQKTGENIDRMIAEFQAKYNYALKFVQEKIAYLKKQIDLFLNAVQKLKRRGAAYLEKVEQEMLEYYEKLKNLVADYESGTITEAQYTAHARIIGNQIVALKQQIMSSVEEETIDNGQSGNIADQLWAYNKTVINKQMQMLQDKSSLQVKLYDYCYKDTGDKSYQQHGEGLHRYYALMEKRLQVEQQYLAKYAPKNQDNNTALA